MTEAVVKRPTPVHPKIAAALGQKAWVLKGPQERIWSVQDVFDATRETHDDDVAAALVPWLNGSLWAYYIERDIPIPVAIFDYLKIVYENVMRGYDPHKSRMPTTRLSLFKAVLGLWRGEDHEEASIAAFEWCSAVANPMRGCDAEVLEWTSAMKQCRWALIGDERKGMLDWMEIRFNESLLPVDSIDWWLEKYVAVPDFPKNVLVMLAMQQARKGGLDLVRSRSRARRACASLEKAESSCGAWDFCRNIAEKTAAFDKEVREKVVVPVIAGHETLFSGGEESGNIALEYSEYLIARHVLITVTLPNLTPLDLVEDMRVRINLHAFNFFMEKRSRKVYGRLVSFGGTEIERWAHAEPEWRDERSDD